MKERKAQHKTITNNNEHINNKKTGMIKITNDNLNGVLLDMSKDKKLKNKNIKNIICLLLKSFDSPAEILSKIKILHTEEDDMDVVDKVAKSIIHLIGDECKCKCFMMEYIMRLDSFSRVVSDWYFGNKEMEYDDICEYAQILIDVLYEISGLSRIEETHIETEEKNKHLITDCTEQKETVEEQQLVDLDDSDEIMRINKGLGKLFDNKKQLSKGDKQKIAKICDILSIMINKNGLFKEEYYEQLLEFVDLDDILYKKIWRVLRHCKFDDVFVKALSSCKNIWRNINFIWDLLGCQQVLDSAHENMDASFQYFTCALIKDDEVLQYFLTNECEIELMDRMLCHSIHNCNNCDILEKVHKKLAEGDNTKLLKACINRIALIQT